MSNLQIKYNHPWLLLLIIPALLLTLIPYFRLDKRYRFTRNRIISMTLHTVAMVIAINLLAGVAFTYEVPNEQNEVILLVDVSDSAEGAESTDAFVSSVIDVCSEDCKIGVVKFGYGCEYAVELTNDKFSVYDKYLNSEDPDGTATALADALKYTAGLFTNKKTSKIVVISDGLETDGDALSALKDIVAEGTVVDVAPVSEQGSKDVIIVSAEVESDEIVVGDSFITNLLIRSNATENTEAAILRLYDNGELYGESTVSIKNGDNEFPVSLSLSGRGLHELTFELITDYELFGDPLEDNFKQNNMYRTYVNLEEFKNILLIERYEGESAELKSLLCETKTVTDVSVESDIQDFPTTLEDMAKYEQVVLVNIAYSDMPEGFESLLNRYVHDLGGGLFTVGGINDSKDGSIVPHAYNKDDLNKSTYYQQMLPVKAEDYTPPIAVMIVIDTSTSMRGGNGEKLNAAVDGALACLDALHDRDYCGVITFSTESSERVAALPVSQKDTIRDVIENKVKNEKGGGTMFSGAIDKAGRALSVIDNVEKKHIILVTDGLPGDSFAEYGEYIRNNKADGITMSIVTVNENGLDIQAKMQQAATEGAGKYYNVTDAQSLSKKIYEDLTEEAIPEIAYGEEFALTVKDRTPIFIGIDYAAIPNLTGYYGTVAKKGATVPLMGEYVPIYATHKYGNGTVGSFMCDLGGEWSQEFIDDVVGRALIMNIVESIFPFNDVRADGIKYELKSDNYSHWLNVHGISDGHTVKVTVNPVSKHIQNLAGEIAVSVAESNRRFTFSITEPGLYEVEIAVTDESGEAVVEIPVYKTFSYSKEYDTLRQDTHRGEELMALIAEEGGGVEISDPVDVFSGFTKTLTMRYDPKLVLIITAIFLFLLDIAVRKFKFKWIHELIRERRSEKK